MTIQPVLWLGLVGLAGCLGAMACRLLRLPGSAGALLGGLALRMAAGWWDPAFAPSPAADLMALATAVFVCFALGCCLELRLLREQGSRILGLALTQALLIIVLVGAAGFALGMGRALAIALGAAAVAGSPAAAAAVAFEMRARGAATQRLFALSAASLVMSFACGYLISSSWTPVMAGLWALGGGVAAGLVLLIPLSRLETRGSILACAGAGVLLVTAAAWDAIQPWAVACLAAIVAGFVCGALSARREALREALRDAAAPGAILLFALWGAAASPAVLKIGLPAALAILASRTAALAAASFLHVSAPGAREGIALLPMGAAPSGVLAASVLLSQIAGLAGSRWWLAGSGDTAAGDDPDAWRARMR